MRPGNVARVTVVLGALLAAAGSTTSTSNTPPPGGPPTYPQAAANQPPPPQQMDPTASLGLWRSTFGAVKIEADNTKGGLGAGAVQGIWVYQKQGQEVIGYFAGSLRGNVLQFRWQEPNNPPLTGEGYLVFDPQGRQYSGRWWSDRRDRNGEWNGWRNAPAQQTTSANPYGGRTYGGRPDAYGAPPAPIDTRPQPGPYDPSPSPTGPYDRSPTPNTPPPSPYQPPPPPPPRGYY